MPANFFSYAWPLALSIILLAATAVILGAAGTLVAALARLKSGDSKDSSQAGPGEDVVTSSYPQDFILHQQAAIRNHQNQDAVETVTSDGIHYTPIH